MHLRTKSFQLGLIIGILMALVLFTLDNNNNSSSVGNSNVDFSSSDSDQFFRDLTFDFQNDLTSNNKTEFSVLDALKRNGHQPVALSLIVNRYCNENGNRVSCPKETKNDDDCSVESKEKSKTFIVPNVVHYVLFHSEKFTFSFFQYLSFKSVGRFIRPDQIFLHGNVIPSGPWWDATIRESKNLYHVKLPGTKSSSNSEEFNWRQHSNNTDVIRLEILLRYGGIYLEMDVLVLKSFDPLRRYPMVLATRFENRPTHVTYPAVLATKIENQNRHSDGIIIARRGAPFLRMMLEQYRSYDGTSKDTSTKRFIGSSEILAGLYPHLINIEDKTIVPRSAAELVTIYKRKYNWTMNYALHLFTRQWPTNMSLPDKVDDITKIDTTLGEMARYILFCSSEIRP